MGAARHVWGGFHPTLSIPMQYSLGLQYTSGLHDPSSHLAIFNSNNWDARNCAKIVCLLQIGGVCAGRELLLCLNPLSAQLQSCFGTLRKAHAGIEHTQSMYIRQISWYSVISAESFQICGMPTCQHHHGLRCTTVSNWKVCRGIHFCHGCKIAEAHLKQLHSRILGTN